MLKIKDSLNGKDYLIDIYSILERNPKLDRDFCAIYNIVNKMYKFDKDLANQWTIHLLNQYTSQGIIDYKNKFDESANIVSFLEDLISIFCKNNSLQDAIRLIHEKIFLFQSRFFIWKFVIYGNDFKNYFFQLLESDLKANRYDTLNEIIKNIVDSNECIEEGLFDKTDFLAQVIDYSINELSIKQTQLDFLYSLVDYVYDNFDKAYLKSFFLEYI